MTTLSPLRDGRITASRVAAVLGQDPYKTPEDIMREMVRQTYEAPDEFTGNWFTDWGTEHEKDALRLYEQENEVTLQASVLHDSQVTVVHPELDFLAASPDGLVDPDGLVEAKCPLKAKYTHISDRPDYYHQIQHQLICTDREWCEFVIWRPEGGPDGRIETSLVMRDPAWIEEHLPTLRAFHALYLETILDPERVEKYIKPLVDVRTDREWAQAAMEFIELNTALNAIEKQRDEARDQLIKLAGDERSTRGFGVLVTATKPRAGSIDYKAIVAKHASDVDPEDFRKPPGAGGWSVRPSTKDAS